jgi:hypothetical protein
VKRYFHVRVGAVGFILAFSTLFMLGLSAPNRFANIGVTGRNEAEMTQTAVLSFVMCGLLVAIAFFFYSGSLAVLIPRLFKHQSTTHYVLKVTLFCFVITTVAILLWHMLSVRRQPFGIEIFITIISGMCLAIIGNRYAYHELAQRRKTKQY